MSENNTQMNAVVFNEYGSSEVLKIAQVAKPVPKSNQVLIKVHAFGINPIE